ncbi:MAG: MFS transporter [Candidatus Thorarchaeota archaeon]|nr:MFS transporter [Candidatus Thorarchaeota archaeon]
MSDHEESMETPDATPVQSQDDDVSGLSWWQSVRRVLSNRNWAIYLGTVWIYSSMGVLNQYFTLYFRDIGISYVMVGVLISLMFVVNMIGTVFSGYIADNYDRRKLSGITMVVNSIAFLMLAVATDMLAITISMVIFGLSSFTGTAGQAYSMEQVDRRLGGVANSLFTLGTTWGLVPLFLVTILLGMGTGFIAVMQLLLFIAGMLYMIAAVVRFTVLKSLPKPVRAERKGSILRDFLRENVRSFKLLFRVFPVFVAVISIDAFSDAFYRFASLYYVNETLAFTIEEINLMILVTLIFSVPLTLWLGRVFDKRGGRGLTIAVYAVMPIAVGLLILAEQVPYIAPANWLAGLDAVYPGLSILFSLAFIATALKSINDTLWFSILGTYILKSLPRQDLGKTLSLTMVVVFLFVSIGPIPAGIIYDAWQGLPLLYAVVILNIIILAVLITKSIEPRVDVAELEAEAQAQ